MPIVPRLRLALVLAGLLLAVPAWAGVISHNGTDYNSSQGGTGQVDVLLGCSVNTATNAECAMSFNAIGPTHLTNWTGTHLLLVVVNGSDVPWTDYHLSFTGMTYVGGGFFPLENMTVVTTLNSIDLYFVTPIPPGVLEGFTVDMFFTDVSPNGAQIAQFPTVPEPTTLGLFGAGLVGLILTRRRRKS